jgi:hypothetical protein
MFIVHHKIILNARNCKYSVSGQMHFSHVHSYCTETAADQGKVRCSCQDKKFNQVGQIVAKARGDECVQCLHANEVHTIKKKQQPRVGSATRLLCQGYTLTFESTWQVGSPLLHFITSSSTTPPRHEGKQ